MVFVSSKKAARNLAIKPQKVGIAAGAFHGDLAQDARSRVLKQFRRRDISFLITTDIAARGIDIIKLSHVVNYDLPSPGTVTGIAAGTLSYNTIETINTVGEIDVLGNNNSITNGDAIPSTIDHTDFGNATVGLTNAVRTFTISNAGSASINVTVPVTITGANSAQYSVTGQPDALLAPGGATTFDVTFTPSTSGTFTAQVNITNDDADENPYTYAIQADGDPAPSTMPTLSEWGMVILCLLMGSFGLAYMRREFLATATAEGAGSEPQRAMLPLDRPVFKRCLTAFSGITILGFLASIASIGYLQMSDAIGGPICAIVASYFAHLVILMKREE